MFNSHFDYFLVFIFTYIYAHVFTQASLILSVFFRFFDEPNPEKIHKIPVPRLGGIGVYLAFLTGLFFTYFLFQQQIHLDQFYWIIIALSLNFLVGLIDDIFGLNPRLKLALITLAGFFLIGAFPLPYSLPLKLGAYLIMIIWFDYLSNAFNLLDGLDGLCSSIALICSLFFFVISLVSGKVLFSNLSLILIAATLGFIPYNFPRARIFLGDSGSYFIGGLLAIISIGLLEIISFKIIAILWILGVPAVDTSLVLLRRVLLKKEMFSGDLKHSYNLLLKKWKSSFLVWLFFCFLSFLFGLTGYFLFFSNPYFLIFSLILPVFLLFYSLKFSRYFKE